MFFTCKDRTNKVLDFVTYQTSVTVIGLVDAVADALLAGRRPSARDFIDRSAEPCAHSSKLRLAGSPAQLASASRLRNIVPA